MHGSTRRAGFSLVELVIAIVMIGIAAAIVVPRFRVSKSQKVYGAARQLAADLEAVRSRAGAKATLARVRFDASSGGYEAFLDTGRDGVFAYSPAERDSLSIFRGRVLNSQEVAFALGSRPGVPGYPATGAITFTGSLVTFDPRGLLRPIGDRGVIYLSPADERNALAAVTVTGSGNVKVWRWRGSAWQ